ncbi:hypothetical protein F4780DRAFT_676489 [Xylariomycetidae sp. FL0641]|nr:hypothetical protein F4780DRAFT_676489 [Xylariomycetidae sp. FL0641]
MEEIVIPARKDRGQDSIKHTYDNNGDIRDVEPLERIQEGSETRGTDYSTSRSGLPSRGGRSAIAWPFHNRNTSEAPSTPRSSMLGGGFFRPASSWQSRTLFRPQDDTVSIAASIVPDYVVNFMRGETPETLARKREQKTWGKREGVEITTPRRRSSFASHLLEFGYYYSSSTHLAPGLYGSNNNSEQSLLRQHVTGWRGGIFLNAILTFIILLVSVICLIFVATTTKLSGEAAVYTGSCTRARHIHIGIHVAINVLTIILLAVANYTFQVLTSPTSEEIARAHNQRRWLEIGIPSLRNFVGISPWRSTVGMVVLLVAIATQVIYNAVIYTTQVTQQTCSVRANGPLLGIVAILNLVMVLSLVAIVLRPSFKPLATLGDAILSFLSHTDETSSGACLMDKADVLKSRWGFRDAKVFTPTKHCWMQAVSIVRWILSALPWLALTILSAAALGLLIPRSSAGSKLPPLDAATPDTAFQFPAPVDAPQLAVIAALPHVLLAMLYLTVNALLSTYFLSYESALYAVAARPLRVSSNPIGVQLLSLYLTLPRPVSWVLLLLFAALGMLLSQAVFPLVLASQALEGPWEAFADAPLTLHALPGSPQGATVVAFNTTALLAFLALLLLIGAVVLGLGALRTPPADGCTAGNPMALVGGPCSAVLSSRCHPARGEGDMWRYELKWGTVDPSRCAFTSGEAGCLETGREYA